MGESVNDRIHSGASFEEVIEALRSLVDFKDEGMPLAQLRERFEELLIPHLINYDHPGFLSLFNFFVEEGAELGARIALKYNQGVTNWHVSPGGAALEELCCSALCRLFGLGPKADATFMYSGTYANQQALYLALHRFADRLGFDFSREGLKGFGGAGRLRVLASKEAHFSLRHAVRILGLGEESLLLLDVDAEWRMSVDALKEALKEIQGKGDREAFCVVATAGTTSTGSIDPIRGVSEISRDVGAWFHVDGAYGLAYSLIPEMKSLYDGLECCDSITWDPHKQFGVPIPSSILFLKNRSDFSRMAIYGEYFNRREDEHPNPGLKSPPTTRPFAALPLVAAMLYLGKKGMIQRLRAPVRAVRELARWMESQEGIESFHSPETGILCYRILPPGISGEELNRLQEGIHGEIQKGGECSLSLTKLSGKSVLRLVALNPKIRVEELIEAVRLSRSAAQRRLRNQGNRRDRV